MEFRKSLVVRAGGLADDMYRDQPNRRILLLSKDTLDREEYKPGDLREQITVDLPGLQELPVGTLVKIGEVTLEVEGDCAPCLHMAETMHAHDPADWVKGMISRRGMFAKALSDGTVRIGDSVTILGEGADG